MCLRNIFLLCSLLTNYAESASYDQRQTGNLNVQVDLKDIHIIALMKGGKEEYVVSFSIIRLLIFHVDLIARRK